MCTALLAGCSRPASDHTMHDAGDGTPVNYLSYDDGFASAGMPDAGYIQTLAGQGVEVVINIAPPDAHGSLHNEAALVSASSMTYLNIPVDWNAPSPDHVDEFLSYMRANSGKSVFLHCQMNMRATAFAMLHRVINERIDPQVAERDMHRIWQPNHTWSQLINETLARYDVDYQVSVPAP